MLRLKLHVVDHSCTALHIGWVMAAVGCLASSSRSYVKTVHYYWHQPIFKSVWEHINRD